MPSPLKKPVGIDFIKVREIFDFSMMLSDFADFSIRVAMSFAAKSNIVLLVSLGRSFDSPFIEAMMCLRSISHASKLPTIEPLLTPEYTSKSLVVFFYKCLVKCITRTQLVQKTFKGTPR